MQQILKQIFYLCAALLLFSSCSSTKKISNVIDENLLNDFLIDSSLQNAHIGVYVFDETNNKILAQHQSNKYFIPASNTKIATCYAAMKYLGDSILGLQYQIANDTTIWIYPTGDPSFLHRDFPNQPIINKLKQYKKVVVSNVAFKANALGKGWAWDDYDESYMPERSALPMYGNTVHIGFGEKTNNVTPKFFSKNIKFSKEKKVDGFKQNKYNPIDESSTKIVNAYSAKQVPFVTNYYTSIKLLNDTLGNVVSTTDAPMLQQELTNNTSNLYTQHIDSLLQPMMYQSNNFFAEQALLMISLKKIGVMSDEQIIDTLLKTDFKNLPQKPRWVDGSGLSRYNLFTPEDMVYILQKTKQEFDWQRVSAIYPTANQGTLKNYYKGFENKIFAKTGSVSNNFSIGGFLKTNSGKDFTFSIMINNYNNVSGVQVRSVIEKYLEKLIEHY